MRCKDENGVECIAMPETKFEYLKDRPFCDALEDVTYNVGPDSENPRGIEFNGLGFGEGDTVEIEVDGEKLSLVAAKFTQNDHEYCYVGAAIDEILAGSVTGEYDWCYICDKLCNTLVSLTNHAFTVKEKVVHTLPMKYSPVSIRSSGLLEGSGDYVSGASISRLTIDPNAGPDGFDSLRGVLTNYDENSNTYELRLYSDRPYFSMSFAFEYGTGISSLKNGPISWTIDKSKFENNISLRKWLGETYSANYFDRPVFFRDIVIDKSRFDPMLFQTTDGLTGSFVTAAGNLISVVVKFNSTSTSGRFDQDWTLTLTLIG